MKTIFLTLAVLVLAGCTSTKKPEYIVFPDGPRMSREKAQTNLVQQTLAIQIKDALDAPLKVISAPLPDYPEGLRRGENAVSGSVKVAFTVKSDGSITNVTVLGQPNSILAALSLDSMLRWRFSPITRNGSPTTQKLIFEFKFQLED